jgi:hypothetical protein
MSVYFITGKLGSGKTLASVGKIREYLKQGRAVATNLDLNLEHLVGRWDKDTKVTRLPDKPNIDDLDALPVPYTGDYNETKTGALVLDECGTWFNTREYRDKSRQPLINKLLHIRKCGWDVFFIIQHIEMIDKQVREGLGELIVTCQRMDKLALPLVTPLFKLLGFNVRPPKIHIAIVKYGMSMHALVVDRWVYNGSDLYAAYDTRQTFGSNDCGINSMLSPYLVFGQNKTKQQYQKEVSENAKKNLKILLRENSKSFFLIGGLLVGYLISTAQASPDKTIAVEKKQETKQITTSLDNIRITASIKTTNGMDYYFWNDELKDSYIPEENDFIVRAIDICKAKLLHLNSVHIVTCKSKFVDDGDVGVMPTPPEVTN